MQVIPPAHCFIEPLPVHCFRDPWRQPWPVHIVREPWTLPLESDVSCRRDKITVDEKSQNKIVMVRWMPPLQGWWKLNTDGASKGNPGPSGGGGVLRDHLGMWRGGFVVNVGICSAVVAEASALLVGLKMAWETGIRQLLVELDSKTVLALLKQQLAPRHPMYKLIIQCQELVKRDWVVKFQHIYREGNQVADTLANWAVNEELGIIHLIVQPPSELSSLLVNDINNKVGTPRSVNM